MGASIPPSESENKFREAWLNVLAGMAQGDPGEMRIAFENAGGFHDKNMYQFLVAKKNPNDTSKPIWYQGAPLDPIPNYLYVNVELLLDSYLNSSGAKCNITQKADPVFDKTINVFFT